MDRDRDDRITDLTTLDVRITERTSGRSFRIWFDHEKRPFAEDRDGRSVPVMWLIGNHPAEEVAFAVESLLRETDLV